MKQVNWKKILLPNLPYVFIALFCTKLGQAARLAPGADFAGKFLHFMEGLSATFAVPLPSFHPADLCVGIAIAAAIAIAVSTIFPALGQGLAAKAAMESIARQPDAAKDIRSTLIIALSLMEALTIYGLLIGFILASKI